MEKHLLDIYVELYKRKCFDKIPIGEYPNGDYYYMTSKQVQAMQLLSDNVTTFVGYGGAARSGKSLIECTAIIFDCLAYAGIAWGLARKELTTLKRTVLITLFKQFSFYGISETDYNYNQQLNKITFQNGSDIFLIDTAFKPSDPLNTRFGGLELTRSAIDESNETDITVINKIFERTGWRLNDKYNLKRKQFECFNPAKNHVYNRFYRPFKDKCESVFRKFISALPGDNPNPIVQEWINDLLETGDKITIERQIYGNFEYDDDPSVLIDYDKSCDIFTNNYLLSGKKYITCDVARLGNDKTKIRVWDGMRCVKKLTIDKSKLDVVVSAIQNLQREFIVPTSQTIVDEDGVGGGVCDFLHCKGFVNNSKPTNPNYQNLRSECYFKLSEVINSGEMYLMNESPTDRDIIVEELGVIKQKDIDKDGKLAIIPKDEIKKIIGRSPDEADCLMMRMWFELNPIKSVVRNRILN